MAQQQEQLFYTSHPCWAWLVDEAVSHLSSQHQHGISGGGVRCSSYKSLPSVAALTPKEQRQHAGYALFRVENPSAACCCWCTSKSLEHLDAKDALLTLLAANGEADTMPPTLLLQWDSSFLPPQMKAVEDFMASHPQVILKAALGAGGFGLYLVASADDVKTVVQAHAKKARVADGLIAKLVKEHGSVPRWSLQAKLSPVLVSGSKSQLRVYVCVLEESREVFLYDSIEVRLPVWSSPESDGGNASGSSLSLEEYEQNICEGSTARAYNTGRVKRDTERLMLAECPELTEKGAQEVVLEVMRNALSALLPGILASISSTTEGQGQGKGRMAVAGVDVLVTESADHNKCNAHILEVNNNPAVADPLKHKMSSQYRQHLVNFCTQLIQLDLSRGQEREGFHKITPSLSMRGPSQVLLLLLVLLICAFTHTEAWRPTPTFRSAAARLTVTWGLLLHAAPGIDEARALDKAPESQIQFVLQPQEPEPGVDSSGFLRSCQGACLSSQDDTPAYFIPPLCFDGSYELMARRLYDYLSTNVPNAKVVSPALQLDQDQPNEPNRYIRVLVTGGQQRFVDEFEFYFTPNDNTIQFRLQHLEGSTDFGGKNRQLLEKIVKALKLDYVPVLRNRKQQWWSFGLDTPFDEFGPSQDPESY